MKAWIEEGREKLKVENLKRARGKKEMGNTAEAPPEVERKRGSPIFSFKGMGKKVGRCYGRSERRWL